MLCNVGIIKTGNIAITWIFYMPMRCLKRFKLRIHRLIPSCYIVCLMPSKRWLSFDCASLLFILGFGRAIIACGFKAQGRLIRKKTKTLFFDTKYFIKNILYLCRFSVLYGFFWLHRNLIYSVSKVNQFQRYHQGREKMEF